MGDAGEGTNVDKIVHVFMVVLSSAAIFVSFFLAAAVSDETAEVAELRRQVASLEGCRFTLEPEMG